MLLAEKLSDTQLDTFDELLSENTSHWPKPLSKLALHGLPGEIVNTIEPHTEADSAAILGHTLISFGNVLGRFPHFKVEADHHYTNENAIFVGETSKGRKGTGDGIVNALFSLNAPYVQNWTAERIKSGLSSGEGIIYHVRDHDEKDSGVKDKRLFVKESEFGGVLRTISRDGNTLSAIIRQSWDSGKLALLTKNNPIKATDAHISIVGHITAEELKKYLFETEIFNGFANRFLWLCVRRSKILPEGGKYYQLNVNSLKQKITEAIEFARNVGEVKRDEGAREIWLNTYPELSEGRPGLAGAVLSRAEAHVMRLALIYALMDQSKTITAEHLLAALGLWEYCEQSVYYIFGDRTGDNVIDKIFDAVCDWPDGMTRTEVFNLFNRHVKRERIAGAIKNLVKSNKVEIVKEETSGRPVEKIKPIRGLA